MGYQNTAEKIFKKIQVRKVPFFAVFFVVVTITYAFLYAIDFVPEAPAATDEAFSTVSDSATLEQSYDTEVYPEEVAEALAAFPHTIVFETLNNRRVPVLNPTSRSIPDLDKALLEGAVRHPDSADFESVGNIFILGHSSYLPNVLNRNFQAFNGVQNLTWGDRIKLISDDTEYIYRVERVYEALASEVIVPFTPGEARLTIATCNSFGSQDDRYIIEAVLVGTQAL